MDPLTILALLRALSSSVLLVVDAIDKVEQAEAAEKKALKDLKAAMSVVDNDISIFKKLISALQSSESGRLYSAFIQRQDAKDAMNELDLALREVEILLDTQQAEPLSSTPKPKSLRQILALFIPFTERGSAVSDLEDITGNLRDKRRKAKCAFKLVWYLYTLSQQRSLSITLKEPDARDPANAALDLVHSEFISNPFAISRLAQSRSRAPFLILNRDHKTATRTEELAKRLGKDWTSDYLDSRNVSPSALLEAQIALFELVWSGTVQHLKGAEDPEYGEYQQTLDHLDKSLQEVIARSKQPRFALSFYGMVKAGKSLFLNAMIGKEVLPSGELPSTAWPCRLVHEKGQVQPRLQVNTQAFNRAIQNLRERGYASRMQNYQPPTESLLDAIVGGLDSQSAPTQEADELRKISNEWESLHCTTRENLLKFEEAKFQLSNQAFGEEEVTGLLGKINDIVRLCKRFGLRFDGTEEDWPVLSMEFSSLKNSNANEIYEFIDLPGIGEEFQNSNWESLVRHAASQSNAIVPVMSFTELSRSDWKVLPKLVGSDRKPRLVVCTHLDRVSQDNLQQQKFIISSTFWRDSPNDTSRVLPCSSLMAFSANRLLEQSEDKKPSFTKVWVPKSIGYHCALTILGKGDPESAYGRYTNDTWRLKIEAELEESRLPEVRQKLTHEMVHEARKNALASETGEAIRLLQELLKRTGRKLLDARRTQDEFEDARREYEETREKLQRILATWDQEEKNLIETSRQQLQGAYNYVSRKAEEFTRSVLQETLKSCEDAFQGPGLTAIEQNLESDSQLGADPTKRALEVKYRAHAEVFLRESQKALHEHLCTLKTEYVSAIRHLGKKAQSSRINTLREALQSSDVLHTDLGDDVIMELASQSVDIRELAYSQIKSKIKMSSTRYTAKTAFQMIEAKIARWWLNPSADDDKIDTGDGSPTSSPLQDDGDEVEEVARRSVEQLGFMLRAPLTAVTSIAWTFSAPVWVFLPESHTYHLSMEVIQQEYKNIIIEPWLEALNKEGEETLIGVIRLSSEEAKGTVDSARQREAARYNEQSGTQKRTDDTTVNDLVAVFVNLLAAEGALKELQERMS